MKLPVIRGLAEKHSIEELKAAENALMEGLALPITVEGADEGEQLTHILAAIEIKEAIAAGKDPRTALRDYAERVRKSIS